MQKRSYLSILAVMLCGAGCVHPPVGEMRFPEGTVQHAVTAGEIEWKPAPPHLPSGCEIAVLEGDPGSSGLFTARFRLEEGFVMPAHTHPNDERVTVLEGRVAVAFGTGATRDDAKEFGPGDYYVNARGAVHTVWSDEPSILQITGIGPWQANFIDGTSVGRAR